MMLNLVIPTYRIPGINMDYGQFTVENHPATINDYISDTLEAYEFIKGGDTGYNATQVANSAKRVSKMQVRRPSETSFQHTVASLMGFKENANQFLPQAYSPPVRNVEAELQAFGDGESH